MGRYVTDSGGISSGGSGGLVSIAGEFGQGYWQVFDPGAEAKTYTWAPPDGVTKIRVRCFGGGGMLGGTASCLGVSATGGNVYVGNAGVGTGGDPPYNYKGGSPSRNQYVQSSGGGGSATVFGDGGNGGGDDPPSTKGHGAGGGRGGGIGNMETRYRAGNGFSGSCAPAAPDQKYSGGALGIDYPLPPCIDSFRTGGGCSNFSLNGGGYGGTKPLSGGGGNGGGQEANACGGGFAMGVRDVTPGQEISIVCGVRAAVILEW